MTLLRMLLTTFCLTVPMVAQSLQFDFSGLAAKASSRTEGNLDGAVLEEARKALPEADKFSGVTGVSIHAYEYAKAGDYEPAVLDALRRQVAGDARWSKLLSSHEEKESADIYVMLQSGNLTGLLLIATEPKQVTVIQATGSVEMAQLQEVVKSAIQFDLAALTATEGK
jgi:hypothetical protein